MYTQLSVSLAALLAIGALFFFSACSKEKQLEKDTALIEQYLEDNNLTSLYQKTDDGIYYYIYTEGIGDNPTANNGVTVHYVGTFLDDTGFDSSRDRGATASFSLTGVIVGWQKAVPMLRVGGRGKFIIPSGLCYGKNPPAGSDIPKNAVLIFDIELFAIN
jgi:FKBP-type peptidyl-prolyl cis-trans isomerase